MMKVVVLALAATALSSGQTFCRDNPGPFCGLIDARILAERLKMEKQRADAEQQLMNAQAAAIRAKTEELRLQTEKQKAATAPTPTPAGYSPVDALLADADFNRLPIALRVKFVKLADPSITKYSDADIAAVLYTIELKVLVPTAIPPK